MADAPPIPDQESSTEAAPHCWCCGHHYPDTDLVHLGEHPEVAVCTDCAHYLNRRARQANATVASRRLYVAAEKIRDAVIARGWHEHPRIGPGLKWLNRRMPW